MIMVRFVNGLIDPAQTKVHAMSVNALARRMQLPRIFVDLRHAATHSALPSLPMLEIAAKHALAWLQQHYWDAQHNELQHVRAVLVALLKSYKQQNDDDGDESSQAQQHVLQALWSAVDANPLNAQTDLIPVLRDDARFLVKPPRKECTASTSRVAAVFQKVAAKWTEPLDYFVSRWSKFALHTVQALLQRIATSQHAAQQQYEQLGAAAAAATGAPVTPVRHRYWNQWCVALQTQWCLLMLSRYADKLAPSAGTLLRFCVDGYSARLATVETGVVQLHHHHQLQQQSSSSNAALARLLQSLSASSKKQKSKKKAKKKNQQSSSAAFSGASAASAAALPSIADLVKLRAARDAQLAERRQQSSQQRMRRQQQQQQQQSTGNDKIGIFSVLTHWEPCTIGGTMPPLLQAAAADKDNDDNNDEKRVAAQTTPSSGATTSSPPSVSTMDTTTSSTATAITIATAAAANADAFHHRTPMEETRLSPQAITLF
jgi:hypothetical protein